MDDNIQRLRVISIEFASPEKNKGTVRVKSVQLAQLSQVAELRGEGASELIRGEAPAEQR